MKNYNVRTVVHQIPDMPSRRLYGKGGHPQARDTSDTSCSRNQSCGATYRRLRDSNPTRVYINKILQSMDEVDLFSSSWPSEDKLEDGPKSGTHFKDTQDPQTHHYTRLYLVTPRSHTSGRDAMLEFTDAVTLGQRRCRLHHNRCKRSHSAIVLILHHTPGSPRRDLTST